MTDTNGNLYATYDYQPYGSMRINSPIGAYTELHRFAGSDYDVDAQLNYMHARYEDRARGRFISEDPVFLRDPKQQNLNDPQSLNSYSYANDNPISRKDPNGRSPKTELQGALSRLAEVLTSIPNLLSTCGTAQTIRQGASNAANPKAVTEYLSAQSNLNWEQIEDALKTIFASRFTPRTVEINQTAL
jgi:RHS repeat-associated protein